MNRAFLSRVGDNVIVRVLTVAAVVMTVGAVYSTGLHVWQIFWPVRSPVIGSNGAGLYLHSLGAVKWFGHIYGLVSAWALPALAWTLQRDYKAHLMTATPPAQP